MKTINWTRGSIYLSAFDRQIEVSNVVRNELNGRRKLGLKPDVVLTEPDDGTKPKPYMPRGFPEGSWKITGIVPHNDPKDHYLNPYFIATNAHTLVEEWGLDASGGYDKPTGRFVRDAGYGIHWPDPQYSTTTLGCIRVVSKDDLLWLVSQIQATMATGEEILFAVSEGV
jgi:hypothetical protein